MEITLDSIEFTTLTVIDQNGNKETVNLQEELVIDEHNIGEELHNQPRKYVYYTSLLEKVRAYLESADLALEMEHARLYEPSRVHVLENTGKNPTKDQISSHIMNQTSFQEKKEQVVILESSVKNLQYVVKAFEQRKDMLIQLSTRDRKQREYEQAIKQVATSQGYND